MTSIEKVKSELTTKWEGVIRDWRGGSIGEAIAIQVTFGSVTRDHIPSYLESC